jgi:hypothetical protein
MPPARLFRRRRHGKESPSPPSTSTRIVSTCSAIRPAHERPRPWHRASKVSRSKKSTVGRPRWWARVFARAGLQDVTRPQNAEGTRKHERFDAQGTAPRCLAWDGRGDGAPRYGISALSSGWRVSLSHLWESCNVQRYTCRSKICKTSKICLRNGARRGAVWGEGVKL